MKTLSPDGFVDESVIATICRETVCGLEYLHKTGKIHRDIKAANIMIGADGAVVVGDLVRVRLSVVACSHVLHQGVAGSLVEEGRRSQVRTFVGTPSFSKFTKIVSEPVLILRIAVAPEVVEQTVKGYSQSADVWSLGIMALELAFGVPVPRTLVSILLTILCIAALLQHACAQSDGEPLLEATAHC
jgi:serine/threonine protein kinase